LMYGQSPVRRDIAERQQLLIYIPTPFRHTTKKRRRSLMKYWRRKKKERN